MKSTKNVVSSSLISRSWLIMSYPPNFHASMTALAEQGTYVRICTCLLRKIHAKGSKDSADLMNFSPPLSSVRNTLRLAIGADQAKT